MLMVVTVTQDEPCSEKESGCHPQACMVSDMTGTTVKRTVHVSVS